MGCIAQHHLIAFGTLTFCEAACRLFILFLLGMIGVFLVTWMFEGGGCLISQIENKKGHDCMWKCSRVERACQIALSRRIAVEPVQPHC